MRKKEAIILISIIAILGLAICVENSIDYVSILNPANGANFTTDSLPLNVTTNYTSSCEYSLWDSVGTLWVNNASMTGDLTATAGTSFNATFTASQGHNTLRLSCNTTVSNYSIVDRSFFVDSMNHSLTLSAPVNFSNESNSRMKFNWTVVDNATLTFTCNLTIDGVVNVSNLTATNGSETSTIVTGLGIGTHLWNVTCWDEWGHTNTSLMYNYSRYVGPIITINYPANATYNVTNLTLPLDVTMSDPGTLWFNYDGGINTTICSSCHSGKYNISLIDYGKHYINIYSNDSSNNLNFTFARYALQLDSDGNGTIDADDTDDDGDGISDVLDTITGNSSNINTKVYNLSIMVNGTFNVGQNFTGLYQLNITNHSGTTLVTMDNYNFTNLTKLVLGNVSIEIQGVGYSVGKIVVRNLHPTATINKTVFVEKPNTTQNWVCVKDEDPGWNTTLTPTCTGTGEIRVKCDGTATGQYHCSAVEGNRLRVSGLNHSIVQTMCAEDWSAGSWGTCTNSIQSRTVTDHNGCGTVLEKPAISQNCTTSTSSSSTSGTTTDKAEETYSYMVGDMEAGDDKTVKIQDDEGIIGIKEVWFKVSKKLYSVKIKVKKLKGAPDNAYNPEGKIYKYWKFENQNLPDDAIEEAKIKFKVERKWLNDNDLNTGDVIVSRYFNETWVDLETKATDAKEDFVSYEIKTDGFSYFAVRAEASEVIEIEDKKTEDTTTDNKTIGSKVLEEEKGWPWKTIGIVALVLLVLSLIGGLIYYFAAVREPENTPMKVKMK